MTMRLRGQGRWMLAQGPRRLGAVVFGAAAALAVQLVVAAPAAAYPSPGDTELVSVASDGALANRHSAMPAVSADGRYVAFQSVADNLVPNDANSRPDVFVRDRVAGTTEVVSVASDGTQGWGESPAISGDGRYVAFISAGLVPNETIRKPNVYVRDRVAGTTELVSVASDGMQQNGDTSLYSGIAISADGRYVAFASWANNLVPNDANSTLDVFVRDRVAGTTERVSVASDGSEARSLLVGSRSPAISGDGRYVAFYSQAHNLVPGDVNPNGDAGAIYVRDRVAGTTERVSVASDGTQSVEVRFLYDDPIRVRPAISGDGRYVVFPSAAPNLVPGDTAVQYDLFVRDRVAGVTERVPVAADTTAAVVDNAGTRTTYFVDEQDVSMVPQAAINGDGRHVAFTSLAGNLVPGDTNNDWDVFVRDRDTGVTERVSVAFDGTQQGPSTAGFANADVTMWPAISGDGRHVAFTSLAGNLVPGDTNNAADVFVRDRGPATGLGALTAQRTGTNVSVSGWASFRDGATIASSDDPASDGAADLGAEITNAAVLYLPEREALLFRLGLTSLPKPGLYTWSFSTGGARYEIRALRAAPTAAPSEASPIALYECAVVCTLKATLSGDVANSPNVLAEAPLDTLGVGEGDVLTGLKASAASDEVTLPDASIPALRVELGIAPADTPQDAVVFSTRADLVEGRFAEALDVSSLPPGAYRAWARACLGDTCATRSAKVT